MFAFVLRIQEVLKEKGLTMEWLAKELGISRPSLYSRLKVGKMAVLKDISQKMETPIHELIVPQEGYEHFYGKNNEWLGIRKI